MQFKEPPKRKSKPITNDDINKYAPDSKNDYSLRRSKSYNGPDTKYYQNPSEETNTSAKHQSTEFCINDLNCFPDDINDMAKRIVKGILTLTFFLCFIPIFNFCTYEYIFSE